MVAEAIHLGVRLRRAIALVAGVCALMVAAPLSPAQVVEDQVPAPARGLDFADRIGQRVPLDVPLTDSAGSDVTLRKYFDGKKPVVLVMAYYTCPIACPTVLQKVNDSLNGLDLVSGKDFNYVVVSFDPTNTTRQAADMRGAFLTGYGKSGTAEVDSGWAFHTASETSARRIADAVGFEYRYLPESGQYSHPIGITVLSGEGMVSRYFYGFDYPSQQVKLALMEASEGRLARSFGDRLLLFCYHYDPKAGVYTVKAMRVMQIGALASLTGLASLIVALRIGERRKTRGRTPAPAGGPVGMRGVPAAAALGHQA